MSQQCPRWEEVKDLPPKRLADFLKDNDKELLWYLQQLRIQDRTIQKENSKLQKMNRQLMKTCENKLLETLHIKTNLDLFLNNPDKQVDELQEIQAHLEQEILILREIINELEK